MTTLSTLQREPTTHDTIDSLAAELQRMQESKRDYIADTRRIGFTTVDEADSPLYGQSFVSIDGVADDEVPMHYRDGVPHLGSAFLGWKVNDHAHRQISQRLGVPAKYYDRMRTHAPKLLDRNVRYWFINTPEERMVRTLDGNARAFLSNRFRRLDNYDLMERAVIPALSDHPGIRFHIANLTPERLVMRAILPSVSREVGLQVGDIVQAGFQMRNSEVGSSALTVEPFTWKLDCLNGQVHNAARVRAYHVGRQLTQEDVTTSPELEFAADTVSAADKATFLMCRDAIRAALSETVLDELVGQMRQAAETAPVQTPVAATQTLANTFDLSDGERDSVLMSLARGGMFNKWGMVNAITDAAKLADTFDRQEEMERLGGDLLTLPTADWNRIAAAAA